MVLELIGRRLTPNKDMKPLVVKRSVRARSIDEIPNSTDLMEFRRPWFARTQWSGEEKTSKVGRKACVQRLQHRVAFVSE